ncbi:hypothetical protein AQUCO_01400575v1 [Aquilegia coerulea]|uniref:Beta-hydroxyacyl-ACP dehydratase n=1 Tax=Aquilegia coerulea TaxID=218851 RepID=A0A2G5DX20_AQUCA|nr:hypothetical protein AQUCO_01400575v1 [Aquilegia coerulea]
MEVSALSNSLVSLFSSQIHLSNSNRTILLSNQRKSTFSRISVSSNSRSLFSSLNLNNRTNIVTRCSADNGVEDSKEEIPIEKRFKAFPTIMDIEKIRNILPHRFPFLLVDRVIEYDPGVSAVAIKNVTINDNFFPGHFPERPIMPGVLMIEACPFCKITRDLAPKGQLHS